MPLLDVQLVPVDNYSRGIALDCEILSQLGGCRPRIRANEYFPPLGYLLGDGRRRVSLFVETVPWWAWLLPRGQVWVIWNHEIWKTYPFLWAASRVLCKTDVAERIARRLRLTTARVGFTSLTEHAPACPPPAAASPVDGVLHLAGQSTYKQTRQVLEAWVEHPEWPRLVATCFGKALSLVPPPLLARVRAAGNIELWDRPAPRERIESWLREIPIHLCPSCAEGFGHSLNESRYYGAIVVSTAGEPMCGYANVAIQGRQQGMFYRVDAAGVATAVGEALALTAERRAELGHANQEAFRRDHAAFQTAFRELVEA